jgi:hypothetical protein
LEIIMPDDLQPLRDAFEALADAWDDLLAAEFVGSRDTLSCSNALNAAEQHYAMLLSDVGASYADQRDELRLATVTGTMRFYSRWQEGPPPPVSGKLPPG